MKKLDLLHRNLLNKEMNHIQCMEIQQKSYQRAHTLQGIKLQQVEKQKDLGVIFTENLKPSAHIVDITSKANQKIGLIKRCFSNLTKDKVKILYTSIIRPALEYASPVWSPWLKKDIDLLENTQKRCLNLASQRIDLETLQERRKRTDLLETFKFNTGLYKTQKEKIFNAPTRTLRGHSKKLAKSRVEKDVAKHFFTNRVVSPWNDLPEHVISSRTHASFKQKLRSLPSGQEG